MHLAENKLSTDLTLIFRALPGSYLLLSPDLIIQDITTSYAEAAGTDREEAVGKSIFDLFPEFPDKTNDTAKRDVHHSLQHVLTHKEPHTLPLVYFNIPKPLTFSGYEESFWKVTNTPVLSAEGKVIFILNEISNITAAVLKEQIHQQNEERLSMLNNALHTVAWEYDIVNNRLTWGDTLFQVFGYTPEQMEPSGVSWDKLVHLDDFETVQQSIAQATSSGHKFWIGEYRFRKADGTYAHVLDQGYFVYDSDNRPLRTFGTIIDLSQNKRTEEELKESDTRFRQLLENLPHMAGTADPKGKVLYFNENWYNYTGMPKGQTDGWASYIHQDDTADVLTTWHEAIKSGNMYEIEYRIRDCMDGSYRTFLERGVPMHGHDGETTLWVCTLIDVEDQKQTLEKIRLKDQQLHNILQLSPAHLFLLEGVDHICRYVSPGVYRMYGNRSYIGKPARDIWPEFVELGIMDLLEQVYSTGTTAQLNELPLMYDRYQNGMPKEIFFNFKYQAVFTNHKQAEGVLVTATEVTRLAQAKRKADAFAGI